MRGLFANAILVAVLALPTEATSDPMPPAYPTVGRLKIELDSGTPGIAMGYVLGVLQTLRHVSDMSLKEGRGRIACLDYEIFLTTKEVATSLVQHFHDSPKWGPSQQLHPLLVQVEIFSILNGKGECKYP